MSGHAGNPCAYCAHAPLIEKLHNRQMKLPIVPKGNIAHATRHMEDLTLASIKSDVRPNGKIVIDFDRFTSSGRLRVLNRAIQSIECDYASYAGRRQYTTSPGQVQNCTADWNAQGVIHGSSENYYGKFTIDDEIELGPLGFYDVYTYSTSEFLYIVGTVGDCYYNNDMYHQSLVGTGACNGRFTIVSGKAFSTRLAWNGKPAFVSRTPTKGVSIVSIDKGELNISVSQKLNCCTSINNCPHRGKLLNRVVNSVQSESEDDIPYDYFKLADENQNEVIRSIKNRCVNESLTSYLVHYCRRYRNTWQMIFNHDDTLARKSRMKLLCRRAYNDRILRQIENNLDILDSSIVLSYSNMCAQLNLKNLTQVNVLPEVGDIDDRPWIGRIYDAIVSGSVFTTAKDFFLYIGKRIREISRIFFTGAMGIIDTIFDKFVDTLVNLLGRVLDPWKIGDAIMKSSPRTFEILTGFMFIGFLIIAGILGASIANALVNFILPSKDPLDNVVDNSILCDVSSESSDPGAIILAATGLAVGGLSNTSYQSVKTYIDSFVGLLKVTGATMAVFYAVYSLLPHAFRRAVCLKWGSAELISEERFSEWYAKASSYEKLRIHPEVLIAPRYRDSVDSCLDQAVDILKLPIDPAHRSLGLSVVSSLHRVRKIISTYENSGATRDPPYAIHVCGKSGVGKSTVSKRVIREMMSINPDDSRQIYSKSNTRFWDGYLGQKVVLYDEFATISDPSLSASVAADYLSLVSCNDFKPEFATVDDPVVGMKGTSVRPKFVMTISNDAYPSFSNVSTIDAIHRRRQIVVEIKLADDTSIPRDRSYTVHREPGNPNNICLTKYSEEERRELAWLRFNILPPVSNVRCDHASQVRDQKSNSRALTFRELMQLLVNDYSRYEEQMEAMKAATEDDRITTRSVSDILDDTERVLLGFQYREPTMTDLFGLLKAEGKNKRKRNVRRSGEESSGNVSVEEMNAISEVSDNYSTTTEREFFFTHEPDVFPDISYGFVQAYNTMIQDALHAECDFMCSPACNYARTGNVLRARVAGTLAIFAISSALFFIGKTIYRYITNKISEAKDPLVIQAESNVIPRSNYQARARAQPRRGFIQGEATTVRWLMQFETKSGTATRVVFPIGNHDFLTFGHAFHHNATNLPEGIELVFTGPAGQFHESFSSSRLVTVAEDIAIYRAGNRSMPNFKNQVNRFASESQIAAIESTLISITQLNGQTSSSLAHIRTDPIEPLTYRYSSNRAIGDVQLNSCITYKIVTTPGDCGCLIESLSGATAGRIIGIHVAGSRKKDSNALGFGTIVTREVIESMLNCFEYDNIIAETTEIVPESCDSDIADLPNCLTFERIPPAERFFIPERTKIRTSILSNHLPFDIQKSPAILSKHDPRSNGVDPVNRGVIETLSISHETNIDTAFLGAVEDELYEHFNSMHRPLHGDISFEEAIRGIPNVLSSICLNSSPGYMLNRYSQKNGKHDWIWYDQKGQINYDPRLKVYVDKYIELVIEGNQPEHRWLGYLKDELVRKAKIEDVDTRIIYCGDLVSFIALRMKFGHIMAAFNNSRLTTSCAIGMNQASYQMDHAVRYISFGEPNSVRYVAGDYKGFDKRHNKTISDLAYRVLKRLSCTDETWWKALCQRERYSKAQMNDMLFSTVNTHFSGSMFTTIINIIINRAYHVYCWYVYNQGTHSKFDDHIRAYFLGDDHMLGIRGTNYNALDIKRIMETQLGQIYTSDKKDEELKPFESLENITFLGCYIRLIHGKYCGIFKKSILEQTLSFTRDADQTVESRAKLCVEYAYMWGDEYGSHLCGLVNKALVGAGYDPVVVSDDIVQVVANRSTLQSVIAESNDVCAESDSTTSGLVGIHVTDMSEPYPLVPPNREIANKAGGDAPMDLARGFETAMLRTHMTWKSSHTAGAVLGSYSVPWDILQLGDQNNIQNMLFSRYVFWTGNTQLIFQVNGMPFQQGLVVAYFYPLNNTNAHSLEWNNAVAQDPCVLLTPTSSTSVKLNIPYNFPRNRMNTFAHEQGDSTAICANLGTLVVKVVSPLKQVDVSSEVTITMYSRFPNSEFHIVRPIPSLSNVHRPRIGHMNTNKGKLQVTNADDIQAEGASHSTVNKTYDIHDIGGNVPVQDRTDSSATSRMGQNAGEGNASAEFKPDLSIPLPMHNPPIASCSVPTHQAFPGMTKSYGLQPTQAMALHPERMDTEHHKYFNSEQTKFEWLLARPAICSLATWKVSDGPGVSILETPLNSVLLPYGYSGIPAIPIQIAIMRNIRFVRFDVRVHVRAIKTKFHSGRLQAVIAYGAPGVDPAHRNVYYNEILDFLPDNSVAEFVIPWQSEMDMVNCWSNEADDPVQDHSLGSLSFYVANQLVAPTSVVDSIDLLFTFTYENVVLAEANPFPGILSDSHWIGSDILMEVPTLNNVTAEADDVIVNIEDLETSEQEAPAAGQVTDKLIIQDVPISTLCIGSKFEHEIKSIHELTRRGIIINDLLGTRTGLSFAIATSEKINSGPFSGMYVYQIANFPLNNFAQYYALWHGSMHYRIFCSSDSKTSPVYEIPFSSGKTSKVTRGQKDSTVIQSVHLNTETPITEAGMNWTMKYVTGSMKPVEQFWGLNGDTKWIDVSLKFNSIFNGMQNMIQEPTITNPSITGVAPNRILFATTDPNPYIYQYTGDDFEFGVFRIPPGLQLEPLKYATGATSGYYDLGGFIVNVP